MGSEMCIRDSLYFIFFKLLPSDDDYQAENDEDIRFKIRRLREMQALRSERLGSDSEYQPWIDRLVGSKHGANEFTPTKKSSHYSVGGYDGDYEPRRSRSAGDFHTGYV